MSRNPLPHLRPTADRRLAVAAATLVVAGMMAAVPFTSVAAASPAASPPDVITFDRTFIDMMVPHHEGAVEMARIA